MNIRVICVHGIGAPPADFAEQWRPLLEAAAPDVEFTVHGLHWNDLLEEARRSYLDVGDAERDALKAFDISLPDLLSGTAGEFVREYASDVLVYCGQPEMRRSILAECTVRLDKLTQRKDPQAGSKESGCILLGHSLGAALLLHLTELEHKATSALTWRGMVLFGHPLGVVSPLQTLMPDPLSCTPFAADSREHTLRNVSAHWRTGGRGRLHLIENRHDIVCSDVRMVVGGAAFDPIPIRQALNETEVRAVHTYNPRAVKRFTAGDAKLDALVGNHDVATYLREPHFVTTFRELLS